MKLLVSKKKNVKSDILNELRSKKFNVLFHGLKMSSNTENSDESESVLRSFLVKDLKFPQSGVDRMHFANVHRLQRRVDATHSSTNSTRTSPPIVVKLCKMKDKFNILSYLQELDSSNTTLRSTCRCLCSDSVCYS